MEAGILRSNIRGRNMTGSNIFLPPIFLPIPDRNPSANIRLIRGKLSVPYCESPPVSAYSAYSAVKPSLCVRLTLR